MHPADLSDLDDIDRVAKEILEEHGGVDILVNNAGRSIRRSVERSYDRFHDYERTMQLNYFGALKLIMAFMPGMRERKNGHIINVSSIGVQTNTPRFSAYVASKSALDAFSRCVAPEAIGDNVHVHHGLHAARAHADDRADRHLRRLPDAVARGGRADDQRRDHRQAEAGGLAARAPSARSSTRCRRRPST